MYRNFSCRETRGTESAVCNAIIPKLDTLCVYVFCVHLRISIELKKYTHLYTTYICISTPISTLCFTKNKFISLQFTLDWNTYVHQLIQTITFSILVSLWKRVKFMVGISCAASHEIFTILIPNQHRADWLRITAPIVWCADCWICRRDSCLHSALGSWRCHLGNVAYHGSSNSKWTIRIEKTTKFMLITHTVP